MNKYYGDIPQDHQNLVKELQTLEAWFYEYSESLSPLSAAKGLTCVAHDYYMMYMTEEGDRILKLADKQFPGYFETQILDHVEDSTEYAKLVENLLKTDAIIVLTALGFRDEQI